MLHATKGEHNEAASLTSPQHAASLAIPNIMPYVASKYEVVGITRSFVIDHGWDRIRINAVCPGTVAISMFQQCQEMECEFAKKNGNTRTIGETPLGRPTFAEEIADICVSLSSSMVLADGGKTAEY